MFTSPEIISCVPYIKEINPYKNTLFEKYLLNKPVLYTSDDGEKIVVYHCIDYNSTEYFPVQIMLHPKTQYRGYFKLPSFKIFHFPHSKKENYLEIEVKEFDPLSDVDKTDKFKASLIRKNLITEETFFKFVEDRMNYQRNISSITTEIDFALSV